MNVRRVAALLRELADAIEQPEEPKRPRQRPRSPIKASARDLSLPTDVMEARMSRAMRRIGAAR